MAEDRFDAAGSRATLCRCERRARRYDVSEALLERLTLGRWRRRLWSAVPPGRVLEIGVGKNLPFHPRGARVVAADVSPAMLARARERAAAQGLPAVHLLLADAQRLPFRDGSFDTVVTSFVFCSVLDPVLGLEECRRVLAPGGSIGMLEHVLTRMPVLGRLMRWLNPLVVRWSGANIDRDTVGNVRAAGFTSIDQRDLLGDAVKLITAARS